MLRSLLPLLRPGLPASPPSSSSRPPAPTVEQIHKIFKLCGSPPEEYWRKSKLPHATLFKPHQRYEKCLRETFRSLPENALSLLETFLSVDPSKRGTASTALVSEYFTMKPYASEPSSLPKYTPNKEMDAKSREDLQRKRIIGRVRGPEETRRPSKVSRSRHQIGQTKLVHRPEESRIKIHGVHKISIKQDRPRVSTDDRMLADMHTMPIIKPLDEAQLKNFTHDPLVGPLTISPTSGFAWTKYAKEDDPHVRSMSISSSHSHNSSLLDHSNVLQAKNNYDFKGQSNGDGIPEEAQADSNGQMPSAMSNRVMVKHWAKHPGSFDSSGVHHSRNLSEAFSKRSTAVHSKTNSVGSQDKGGMVKFSGPLLSHSDNVDELLERHEQKMREAVRRPWFQKEKHRG